MKDPMHDTQFLLALDNDHNKIIYAKIISLTQDELPIEAIEGIVLSGSINIDGASAVRRSCNLTMTTKLLNINEVYWGFTTKIKIEIGLLNNVDTQYDKIIWFKLGIYILTEFKTSQLVNNYVITLTGKDKMCLLNGDISGHFNAETNLSIENRIDENGNKTEYNLPIKYIIREMIHHYAQEPWANIVINNLEDYGLEMLDNSSENNYYLWRNEDLEYCYLTNNLLVNLSNNELLNAEDISDLDVLPTNFTFLNGLEEDANQLIVTNKPDVIIANGNKYNLFKIPAYGAAGYRRTDLTYEKELIAAAGDTVTSVLDKLVKMLGSFEYFYNLDGLFVFQAKDTYFTSIWSAAENLNTAQDLSYIDPALMRNKVSYSFENGQLTTAIQNNPNMLNVRNDFTIWGKKRSSNGSELPIHARYAIDKKPLFYCSIKYLIDKEKYNKAIQLHELDESIEIPSEPKLIDYFYITKEGLELLKSIVSVAINPADYRVHIPPRAFSDDIDNWWNMMDWAELYKAYTGHYPTDYIKNYLSPGTPDAPNYGFLGTLHFANGLDIAPNTYNLGSNAFGVVDIQRLISDPNESVPAGFKGVNNGRLVLEHSAFMHRFNGCWHHYTDFIQWLQQRGYESYFYRPELNFTNEQEYTEDASPLGALWALLTTANYANHVVDWRELIYKMAEDYYQGNHDDDFELKVALANRNFSKVFGVLDYYTGKTGYELYYHDIEGFWRLLYNPDFPGETVALKNWKISEANVEVTYDDTCWNQLVTEDPTLLLFWFDFYETDKSSIGKFSVPAIGARTKVVNDDDVRVIVYPDVPDVVYLLTNISDDDAALSANNSGYSYLSLSLEFIDDHFSLAVRRKSAKETMDNLLYNYSHTNDSITLTTIPIYYLLPNTIIHVHDDLSHIDGYYETKKITLPLTYNGTMSISAVKIPLQIY